MMQPRSFIQYSRVQLARMFAVISCAVLSACSPPHEPVNLAGNNWLGYQPFYLAGELAPQLLEDAEFTIHALPSTSNVMRLMAEQQLDGGFLTVDEALVYQQRTGEALCVAMVTDVSLGGDAIVMHSDWRERDEPLRVAHEATTVGGYLLKRARQMDAFEGRSLVTSVATLNRHVQLYASDSVDGVITFQPVLAKIHHQQGEVIFDSSMIAGEIVDLLVIKQDVWQQHQQHIMPRLQLLWQSSVNELVRLTPQVSNLVAMNTGLSRPQIKLALNGMELIGATSTTDFDLRPVVDAIGQFLWDNGELRELQELGYCREQSEAL